MLALAAHVARGRLARGVKLNYPESLAIITDFVMEGAREGRSVADLMSETCKLLRRGQVMEGILEESTICKWKQRSPVAGWPLTNG